MAKLLYKRRNEEEHGELLSEMDLLHSAPGTASHSASSIPWFHTRLSELALGESLRPYNTRAMSPLIYLAHRTNRSSSFSPLYEIAISEQLLHSRWLSTTLTRIRLLLRDGGEPGAAPVEADRVLAALSMLVSALDHDAAPPRVVALNDGGLQFDWHRGGLDVELIFSPDAEESGAYVRVKATGREEEGPLDSVWFREHVGDRLNIA